jgi:BirA family transcriptional regulator, biotin operon repressor / biotin---[acetyl-CoA-carboxylase] ligase
MRTFVIVMVALSFQIVPAPVELAELARTRFADVRWHDEVDSTNTQLLALARGGAPEGVVLGAEHQRAGRGRLGRVWQAPRGASILVSVLVRPALAIDRAHLVTVAAGLAAAEACTAVAGFTPRLKWPNDLVVEAGDGATRKLAGLLSESVVDDDRLGALVVGMGLNVNWPAALPEELASIAVSANHVVGRPVDRVALLTSWLIRFDARYGALLDGGAEALLDDYRAACATLGRNVRVELAGEVVEGVATDVTRDGHLVLAPAGGGATRTVVAGDVVHLRPAG